MKNTALLPYIKLRFNLEHPNLEECYAYGYECALAEVNEEENPFNANSQESNAWLEGWWDGFYGENPLYELASSVEAQEEVSAANDQVYNEGIGNFIALVLEITGIIAVSAAVGYQVIELVA